jgi:hypothetical protein
MEILVDLLIGQSPHFLLAAVRRVPLFIGSSERVTEPRHITFVPVPIHPLQQP